MEYRKKLIEVALPLPEINDASAYDKMPGIGPHPKGIHHWWARLPLPTARAVLFASVVNDPSAHPERWPTEEAQQAERERLFDIIRRMMEKRLHEHPEVYAEAHTEMLKHTGGELPALLDPFAGGGSIPLEANRLGFQVHAHDLNPVAVLLNKCNLEIAPCWAGRPPVNPEDRNRIAASEAWSGTHGLAADVRFYARVIRERALQEIGHLYPKAVLPKENGGGNANVIAWIWARTVASPDPAARAVHVPLLSTFWLSSKKGSEAWLDPIIDKSTASWHFDVRTGAPADRAAVARGTKIGRAQFRCLLTGTPIPDHHIKAGGLAGRLGTSLVAVVAEGKRGRLFLPATAQPEAPLPAPPRMPPREELVYDSRYLTPPAYGLSTIDSLFTPRQLTTLVTLSDLVRETKEQISRDAHAAGLPAHEVSAYTRAIATFLALGLSRTVAFSTSLCRWGAANEKVMHLFGRQAIPMLWDFAEANVLGHSVGSWYTCSQYVADCIEVLTTGKELPGDVCQSDAAAVTSGLENVLISTDPPYYDNVPYADISDLFYVWLRRTIGDLYPELFRTVLTPKLQELTASAGRFEGDKEKARQHFESGFRRVFSLLRKSMSPEFPLTLYYAFKQADEERDSDEPDIDGVPRVDLITGWETLLEAVIASGFQVTATWPVRASQKWRMRARGSNALASYIVLACRPRADSAPETSRRSFVAELKRELPVALRYLQQGNIAPVDFAQAAIGPGMAIYSRYARILESSGKAMSVRAALRLINQTLAEVLSERQDEFDAATQWAIAWFEQHGFSAGEYGQAELLSKAKVTSIGALEQAGIIRSRGGEVRLLRPEELPREWAPETDKRLTVWEATHHLVRLYFHEQAGDEATAALLQRLGPHAALARDLAYLLFDICERKKRAREAQAYNALVLGWSEVARLAQTGRGGRSSAQTRLFEGEE